MIGMIDQVEPNIDEVMSTMRSDVSDTHWECG